MKILFFIFILVSFYTLYGQEKTFGQKAISNFLSGDINSAETNASYAIKEDSLNYSNYYLRGVIRLYQNDTLNAIHDFNNLIRLKKSIGHITNDSIVNSVIINKPKRTNRLCGQPEELSYPLFEIMLGTWFFLNDNKNESCNTFKSAQTSGIKSIKTLLKSVCG